ncbi:uncharacterized protein LOC119689285 [Teleopsis dalmanni]|uniref:uncharacterized protein LOC119689285 n=1 Tax=Teleopsis dalmanni TaxID=139649 RepID=UPI0018CE16E4|nr:uncharacterized protein LOC119689285 [Teleopsis dalmanni]
MTSRWEEIAKYYHRDLSSKSATTATTSAATAATATSITTTTTTPIASGIKTGLESTKISTVSFSFPTTSVSNSSGTSNSIITKLSKLTQLDETTTSTSIAASPNTSSPNGKYVNWSSQHTTLALLPWCCIGDLIAFCDKYEYKTVTVAGARGHNIIVNEVKALLNSAAPFDSKKRFPENTRNTENLWVCIGRCAGVEYHLKRILTAFRKPLDTLSADKQRIARQNFHLAVNELRLDISARISEVRLYDRNIFEKDFHLKWEDEA